MDLLVAIFCTLVVAAGVYYFRNTTASDRLIGVEPDANNRLRRSLRRVNGVLMLLLAGAFFWGSIEMERRSSPTRFIVAWLLVIGLVIATMALAVVDVWLTGKLRRSHRKPP
ncbi:MAG: hypothetical protein QM770_20920 [Tepidisphaeraceae bacterium]